MLQTPSACSPTCLTLASPPDLSVQPPTNLTLDISPKRRENKEICIVWGEKVDFLIFGDEEIKKSVPAAQKQNTKRLFSYVLKVNAQKNPPLIPPFTKGDEEKERPVYQRKVLLTYFFKPVMELWGRNVFLLFIEIMPSNRDDMNLIF